MRSRRLFAVSLASRTALRRAIAVVTLLLVTCTIVGLDVASAEGREIQPAQFPVYQEALLKAESERDVDAVLRRLMDTSRGTHGTVYGKIVGPILKEAPLTAALPPARRHMLLGSLIIHLIAEHPEGDEILFLGDIILRLGGDPALVDYVLESYKPDPVTKRRVGWDRLLRLASKELRSPKDGLRAAAIRLVAHCECEDAAVVLAALHDALRSGERKPTESDEAAYLEAAERLLLHAFPDVGALVAFLNPIAAIHFGTPESRESWTAADKERIRAELYREVIKLNRSEGGEEASKERQAALDYGRAVIEKARGPEDLRVFFDPDRTRVAELQQEALRKAEGLEPKPTQAWADLLVAALDHSSHMAVLEAIVPLLAKTFTEPSEPAQLLASAVARRLQGGVESDRVDLREKLATVLGRIGTAADVSVALEGRARIANDPQAAVWSKLISAFGVVRDGQVRRLRPHYSPAASRPDWERLAVAKTLGQQGFRTADGEPPNRQSPQAALFLMHILHGWPGVVIEVAGSEDGATPPVYHLLVDDGDVNDLETEAGKAAIAAGKELLRFPSASPDASDDVREAAANSLLFHRGPQSAIALGRAAEEENDVGDAALRTLGVKLRRSDDNAARAMARLVASGLTEERLLVLLDIIARTPAPTNNVPRMTLGKAVTDLLNQGGTEPVLRSAAAAAANLRQVNALKPVYLFWHGIAPEETDRRAVWQGLLRAVVAGVAKGGKGATMLDLELENAIKALVGEGGGHEENAGMFATMLGSLGADGERFSLKRLRAELALQYVGVDKGRTKDQRRDELDDVIALYKDLATQAVGESDQVDMQRMLYHVLHTRWTQWLRTGEDGEDAYELQVAALEAAIKSGNADTARRARESELAALQARKELPKEKADAVAKLVPQLDRVVEGDKAPKKKAK